MTTQTLSDNSAVIVRLDRTIQHAAARAEVSSAGGDWMPAFAAMKKI